MGRVPVLRIGLIVKRLVALLTVCTLGMVGVVSSVLPTASASSLTPTSASASVSSLAAASTRGGFTGKAPTRVLSTVTGVGAARAKLGAGRILTLKIPGLPAGTTAVAINVTAATGTAASYLTVYQGGSTRPGAASLSFAAGQTVASLVVVPLGPGNTVSFYNRAGTVNVLGDLVGSFNPATGAGFTGRAPARVLSTVTGVGAARAKLGAGRTLTLKVPGLPAGTTAVAINVTAATATAASSLTVYPGGSARPGGSNLSFAAAQTIANLVLVPLGPGNTVSFYNGAGTVNVLGDLVGSFQPATTTGGGFTGRAPARVLSTVTGVGAARAMLGAGRILTLKVPGLPAGTTAVAINVTAATATAASYLTVYQGGSTRPGAASLSFAAGRTVSNLVLVPVGPGNTVSFYNRAGTVNVLGDLVGYVEPGTPVPDTTAVLAVTNSSGAVTRAAVGAGLFFDPSQSLAGPAGVTLQSGLLDYGDGSVPEAFTGDPTSWFSVHNYPTAGVKTATLTVTDSASKSATDVVTIHVFDLPTATITATGQPQAGVPFTFTLGATTPAGTSLQTWTTYGAGVDGGFGTAPPATYTYTFTEAGTYAVSFSVVNDVGGEGVASVEVTVLP